MNRRTSAALAAIPSRTPFLVHAHPDPLADEKAPRPEFGNRARRRATRGWMIPGALVPFAYPEGRDVHRATVLVERRTARKAAKVTTTRAARTRRPSTKGAA